MANVVQPQDNALNLTKAPASRPQAAPAAPVLSSTASDARYVRLRQTAAWLAPTGAMVRTALAGYSAPTISNPPTQAEVQALANAVQDISQHLSALIADLITNGNLTT
jgi:hypothetical protein